MNTILNLIFLLPAMAFAQQTPVLDESMSSCEQIKIETQARGTTTSNGLDARKKAKAIALEACEKQRSPEDSKYDAFCEAKCSSSPFKANCEWFYQFKKVPINPKFLAEDFTTELLDLERGKTTITDLFNLERDHRLVHITRYDSGVYSSKYRLINAKGETVWDIDYAKLGEEGFRISENGAHLFDDGSLILEIQNDLKYSGLVLITPETKVIQLRKDAAPLAYESYRNKDHILVVVEKVTTKPNDLMVKSIELFVYDKSGNLKGQLPLVLPPHLHFPSHFVKNVLPLKDDEQQFLLRLGDDYSLFTFENAALRKLFNIQEFTRSLGLNVSKDLKFIAAKHESLYFSALNSQYVSPPELPTAHLIELNLATNSSNIKSFTFEPPKFDPVRFLVSYVDLNIFLDDTGKMTRAEFQYSGQTGCSNPKTCFYSSLIDIQYFNSDLSRQGYFTRGFNSGTWVNMKDGRKLKVEFGRWPRLSMLSRSGMEFDFDWRSNSRIGIANPLLRIDADGSLSRLLVSEVHEEDMPRTITDSRLYLVSTKMKRDGCIYTIKLK